MPTRSTARSVWSVCSPRCRRLHELRFASLPDGAMVLLDGACRLVLGGSLLRWTPFGYRERAPRPAHAGAEVITPPMLLALLSAGWSPLVPLLHPSVRLAWG